MRKKKKERKRKEGKRKEKKGKKTFLAKTVFKSSAFFNNCRFGVAKPWAKAVESAYNSLVFGFGFGLVLINSVWIWSVHVGYFRLYHQDFPIFHSLHLSPFLPFPRLECVH